MNINNENQMPRANKFTPLMRAQDGVLSGITLGFARYLDVEVLWLRLAWIILGLASLGFVLFIYAILSICIPIESKLYKNNQPMILGVCLRVAKKFDWDTGLTRASFCFFALGSLGTFVVIYLLLNMFLPKE